MGHRNVDTLYRHYIDEIEEVSDAEVYWTLDPEKVALLAQQIMNLPSKGKNSLENPTELANESAGYSCVAPRFCGEAWNAGLWLCRADRQKRYSLHIIVESLKSNTK
jgi:hypothetical protein